MNKLKTFSALNVSSKFAICGLPIRVDTYKTCSFGCSYCFANNRKIMEFEKILQVGNIDSVKRKLDKIFNKHEIKENDLLGNLILNKYTWHCGGMSDPFQPCEEKYHITEELIKATKPYDISILFSTKTDDLYGSWKVIDPKLHTFQLSVTNVNYSCSKIEPNVACIEKRYHMYKMLKSMGFRVGVRIQPFIPNITTTEIIDMFSDADHFTIEGIKIVPQNQEHKEYILNITGLKKDDFTQMGLLNLKPEIRLKLYQPFIDKFESMGLSYSIADNDLHHLGNNFCCCGDKLIDKSTKFNNTYLCHQYGDYNKSQLDDMINESGIGLCKCSQLFTSNRQEGCVTVQDFFDKRFYRKTSPFSPQFLYKEK